MRAGLGPSCSLHSLSTQRNRALPWALGEEEECACGGLLRDQAVRGLGSPAVAQGPMGNGSGIGD